MANRSELREKAMTIIYQITLYKNNNKSINQIAKELGRNHSTILREVDRNRKYSEPSSWNNYKINHPDLDLSCKRLKHSPYVCNGCKSRSGCRKIRWTYYAREAQKSHMKN